MDSKKLNSSVDRERWLTAQGWEKDHWLRNHKNLGKHGKNLAWRILSWFRIVEKYRGDDRNRWWMENFANYSFLPQTVDSALEVGCGPYTNIRLISKACRPSHITLSDPLIKTYAEFKMTFVNEAHRTGACALDNHPLEELPFGNGSFDLAVMINVLDHVRDARACMANLIRVVKPGGFVIIGQDLTNEEDRRKQPEGLEVGHPVTVDENWFDEYLDSTFDVLYRKIISRESGWAPEWHYGTFCFGGRK